jgi:hypothetical protein
MLLPPIPEPHLGRLSEGARSAFGDFWATLLAAELQRRGAPPLDFKEILCGTDLLAVSRAVAGIRRVRREVAEPFVQRASPLYRMRIPPDENQRRHFPLGIWSKAEICQRTKTGHSLFYSGIDVPELELVLYDVIELRLEELIATRHRRVACDGISPIGASRGEETSMMLFDMDMGSVTAHCYPIPHDFDRARLEDPDLMYCSSDILQGYVTSR